MRTLSRGLEIKGLESINAAVDLLSTSSKQMPRSTRIIANICALNSISYRKNSSKKLLKIHYLLFKKQSNIFQNLLIKQLDAAG